jgi:hypothetical protein
MKFTSFAFTIIVHIVVISQGQILDDLNKVVFWYFGLLSIGIVSHAGSKKNSIPYAVGWGIIWGSIATLILATLFYSWLLFNFPG